MTTETPDASAAIAWIERARHADAQARAARAYADAIMETPDPDPEHADVRVRIYTHAAAIADLYEERAGSCRERADDAQQLRRARYDLTFAPVTEEMLGAAKAAAPKFHVCTARNCACRRPA